MDSFRKYWFSIVFALLAGYAIWLSSAPVRSSFSSVEKPSSIYGWDTSFYNFWLRSLVFDQDVDFSNEIELCDTLPGPQKRFALYSLPRTENDLVPNKYPIGWAVFHAPWYLVGHGVAMSLDAMGVEVRTDGFGKVYEVFVYAGSVSYAFLSLWLTYLLLRRYFGKNSSATALWVVTVCGFLVYYQFGQYAMAHNLTYLCVVSVFYWSLAVREMPPLVSNWVMLGLSTGLLLITRYQAGVYLFFPFAVVLVDVLKGRTGVKAVAYGTVVLLGVVALQLVAWKALYGSWLVYSYQGEGFNWESPAVWKSLFDPFHGLVYWHPIFLLGGVGLFGFLLQQKQPMGLLVLLSVAAVVYVNSAWETWWFGASFGGRAYEGVTLFVCFGIAWLLEKTDGVGFGVEIGLRLFFAALAVWSLGVLEVCVLNWRSGISLEEPVTHADFWEAIKVVWLGRSGSG
ncbi:glycosyltransferase family 39 protein [Pelagicoccus mobilis]|uniref:Glycosyltransferase family 39 protein n=1 Tax=Pelagicoccus mobilis TaxID=415221 RepID=A0A934S2G8_9BACT|nr:glycosyltransferase family 39 protein [Pelagicoccus mobilis]MBK1878214.1 glycosyltransferase family 39 protein [Pelagicoccus mobilis]